MTSCNMQTRASQATKPERHTAANATKYTQICLVEKKCQKEGIKANKI